MPTYDWLCEKCELEVEEIQSIKEYTGKKACVQCGGQMARIFSRCSFYHTGASVKDAYKCPALGQVIKSDQHRKELSRKLGVEEIGNEKPETIHKHFDSIRAEKRKKIFEDV